jgi:hypothetical protein
MVQVKLKPNRTDFDRSTNEGGGIIIKGNTGSDRQQFTLADISR